MRALRLHTLRAPALLLTAWLVVVMARFLPVGGEWHSVAERTWFAFLLSGVIYFAAMFVAITYRTKNANSCDILDNRSVNPWIQWLSLFSTTGATLIGYEFAVIRGYGFSTPVSTIRLMEVAAAATGFEGSLISGIGRLLTPTLIVAWTLASLSWSTLHRRTLCVLFLATCLVLYQQMMFEGGRLFLASLVIIILFTRLIALRPQRKTKQLIIKLTLWPILLSVVLVLFASVFTSRYDQQYILFDKAYEGYTSDFDLTVSDEAYNKLAGSMSSMWLAVFMLWCYATQGLNELNVVLTHSSMDFAWGGVQFPQLLQGLNKLTGLNLRFSLDQNLLRSGTYCTLYGFSYIDFGYWGALMFIAAIGWMTGRSIKMLDSRCLNGLALNAPLLATLGVFAPIVSLVANLWPAFLWALLVGSSLKWSASHVPVKT